MREIESNPSGQEIVKRARVHQNTRPAVSGAVVVRIEDLTYFELVPARVSII